MVLIENGRARRGHSCFGTARPGIVCRGLPLRRSAAASPPRQPSRQSPVDGDEPGRDAGHADDLVRFQSLARERDAEQEGADRDQEGHQQGIVILPGKVHLRQPITSKTHFGYAMPAEQDLDGIFQAS